MDKTIYTIGGIILAIIGLILIYETYTNNLIDIMFIIGIVLIMVGIILIILKTTNKTTKEDIYNTTLNSLNNKKNNLKRDTYKIAELDKYYNTNKSESIFTSINKQFAERFNDKNPYETPKKYNSSLSDYEDIEIENQNELEGKKVLKINENWNEPNEDLTPIKTVHEEEPPASIYKEDENQSYNFKAKYQRPEKITRKPKKRDISDEEEKTREIIKPTVIPNLTNSKNTITTSQVKDNSYIMYEDGIISSKEAYDSIIQKSQEEILIQIPNLKDISAKSLAKISEIKTKLIIQEFDEKEEKYKLLLNTLIKQGVEIKTLPTIDTSNLISDKNNALLISKNHTSELQYGITYTDKESVQSIISGFNTSWKIAKSLNK